MMNTFQIMSLTSGHANAQASVPLDSIGESISYGVPMAVIGMATVFVVLFLLMILLNIFRLIFSRNGEPGKTNEPEFKSTADTVTVHQSDDGELVAAITAAIHCFRSQNEPSSGGFRVVSFKKR